MDMKRAFPSPLSSHVLRVVLRVTALAKAREEAEGLEEPDESAGGELDESALRGVCVVEDFVPICHRDTCKLSVPATGGLVTTAGTASAANMGEPR